MKITRLNVLCLQSWWIITQWSCCPLSVTITVHGPACKYSLFFSWVLWIDILFSNSIYLVTLLCMGISYKRFSKSSSYGRMEIIFTVNYKKMYCLQKKMYCWPVVHKICMYKSCCDYVQWTIYREKPHTTNQQLISIRFQLCALQVQSWVGHASFSLMQPFCRVPLVTTKDLQSMVTNVQRSTVSLTFLDSICCLLSMIPWSIHYGRTF